MARPLGENSSAVLDALASAGPMTVRALSARLGISVGLIEKVCWRLSDTGRLYEVERVPLPPARRPVAVMGLVDHAADVGLGSLNNPPPFWRHGGGMHTQRLPP